MEQSKKESRQRRFPRDFVHGHLKLKEESGGFLA
jgi:hypothetical protein